MQALCEFTPLALRYPIPVMATVDEIRRANLALLAGELGGVRALSARLNKSESQVSQWVNASKDFKSGKPRGMRSASCREIEAALGKPTGWMDEHHADGGRPSAGVAQSVSQPETEHAPHIEWGTLMHAEKLPRLFWATLQDDSMAPRAPAGRRILFDTTIQPEAGDGVLIRDGSGGVYFRLYRSGAGARWTAHAVNAAFGDLDSERDGLQVLAVLKAEEGRWK